MIKRILFTFLLFSTLLYSHNSTSQEGVVERDSCDSILNPVNDKTWCFERTGTDAGTLKIRKAGAWQVFARVASGSTGQVVFFSANGIITGSTGLNWNDTTKVMTFGSTGFSQTFGSDAVTADRTFLGVDANSRPVYSVTTATNGATTGSFVANMVGSTGGPTTPTQNGWIKSKNPDTGATIWIPIWR